jgi:hypothetical protein
MKLNHDQCARNADGWGKQSARPDGSHRLRNFLIAAGLTGSLLYIGAVTCAISKQAGPNNFPRGSRAAMVEQSTD